MAKAEQPRSYSALACRGVLRGAAFAKMVKAAATWSDATAVENSADKNYPNLSSEFWWAI
jgi:hypothetical protein